MSRKLLFTSGPDLPYWNFVKSRFENYAARIGAELIVLPKRPKNPQWVIFDAMGMTPKGSLGAWIDADIIIAKDAPDIFQYGNRLMVCEPRVPHRVHPKWRRGHASNGVPNMRPYPITAVVSWGYKSAQSVSKWFNDERHPERWGDQEVLALAIWELDLAMHFFPSKWHRMLPFHAKGIQGSSFAHAAGSTRRPARKLGALRNFNRMMREQEND